MKSENNLRMQLKEALDNLWARIKSLVSGLDTRVTALEQGGGGGGQVNVIEAISFNGTNVPPDASKRVSLQEADPTVPSWAKEVSKPTYTASEVGALADNTTFVSGVKGAAEAAYRSGQVELSPADLGAFGRNSVIASSVTDANDTTLYGSAMLSASACAHLPTSTSGHYYQVEFCGGYQMASRHSSNGITEVWARYYANGGWYPWVRLDSTGVISNTSLGTYSGFAAAAEAVWAAMGNTSVKVGRITIEVSGYGSYITVYLAVKSSENYAAVLFVSFDTTLHLAIKTNGTTAVRNISTTAG